MTKAEQRALHNAKHFLRHLQINEKDTGLSILFLETLMSFSHIKKPLAMSSADLQLALNTLKENNSILKTEKEKFSIWLEQFLMMIAQEKSAKEIHIHLEKLNVIDKIIHLILVSRKNSDFLQALQNILNTSPLKIAEKVLWFKLEVKESQQDLREGIKMLPLIYSDDDIYRQALAQNTWPMIRMPSNNIFVGPGIYQPDLQHVSSHKLEDINLFLSSLINNHIDCIVALGIPGQCFFPYFVTQDLKYFSITVKAESMLGQDLKQIDIVITHKTDGFMKNVVVYHYPLKDLGSLDFTVTDPKKTEADKLLNTLLKKSNMNIFIHCHLGKGCSSVPVLALECQNQFNEIFQDNNIDHICFELQVLIQTLRGLSPGFIHNSWQLFNGLLMAPIRYYSLKLANSNSHQISESSPLMQPMDYSPECSAPLNIKPSQPRSTSGCIIL